MGHVRDAGVQPLCEHAARDRRLAHAADLSGDRGADKCRAGLSVYPGLWHGRARCGGGNARLAAAVGGTLSDPDPPRFSDTAHREGALCVLEGQGGLAVPERAVDGADVKPCELWLAGAAERHQPAGDEHYRGAHCGAQDV